MPAHESSQSIRARLPDVTGPNVDLATSSIGTQERVSGPQNGPLQRANQWVRGLGYAALLHEPTIDLLTQLIRPEKTSESHAIRHKIDLAYHVSRPAITSWNPLRNNALNTDPTVSIHSSDIQVKGRFCVYLYSGEMKSGRHRDRALESYFHDEMNAGCLSSAAGPRAEAYAKGAFLGFAIALNPAGIRETEDKDSVRIGVKPRSRAALSISHKEHGEISSALDSGKVDGYQVFPSHSSTSPSIIHAPDHSSKNVGDGKGSNFVIDIMNKDTIKARVSFNPESASMKLETLDKRGNVITTCERHFDDIVSATAAAIGARHALEQIYGNHPRKK